MKDKQRPKVLFIGTVYVQLGNGHGSKFRVHDGKTTYLEIVNRLKQETCWFLQDMERVFSLAGKPKFVVGDESIIDSVPIREWFGRRDVKYCANAPELGEYVGIDGSGQITEQSEEKCL